MTSEDKLAKQSHKVDLCVVGGGLAGMCAAIAAARHGAKVVLMQDRPVLGGNASSEIRMWVSGAHGSFMRETGICHEIELENDYRNPTQCYSIWDSILPDIPANREARKKVDLVFAGESVRGEFEAQARNQSGAMQDIVITISRNFFASKNGHSIDSVPRTMCDRQTLERFPRLALFSAA